MDSQATKTGLVFFVAVTLGLPAIVLLADAILDQGVTITHMSQGYADTEEDLENLAQIFPKGSYKAAIRLVAPRRPLRGHHGYS